MGKTTFAERKEFLDDLAYVMHQASAAILFHQTGGGRFLEEYPLKQLAQNAILESSLAFLRKLNEFFGGDKDISISDYQLPNATKDWLFSKEDSEILNNWVMHLSLQQARHGKKYWGEFMARYLPEARRRYDEFLSELRVAEPRYFADAP